MMYDFKLFRTNIFLSMTLIWLISTSYLKAQTPKFTFSDSVPKVSGDASKTDHIAHSMIYSNFSKATLKLRWVRIKNVSDSAWTTAICDRSTCYSPIMDSLDLDLTPFDSSKLDVHFRPNKKPGNDTVLILIYDVNGNRDEGDTIMYTASIFLVGIEENLFHPNSIQMFMEKNSLRVLFENPAEFKGVKIFNLSGTSVYQSNINLSGEQFINLNNLNTGVYFIQFQTRNDKIFVKKFIKN